MHVLCIQAHSSNSVHMITFIYAHMTNYPQLPSFTSKAPCRMNCMKQYLIFVHVKKDKTLCLCMSDGTLFLPLINKSLIAATTLYTHTNTLRSSDSQREHLKVTVTLRPPPLRLTAVATLFRLSLSVLCCSVGLQT